MTAVTREIESSELDELLRGRKMSRLGKLRRRAHALVIVAAHKAAVWQVHRSLPGAAGIVLVSAGLGGIFHNPWAGALMLGAFLLRIDNRM